MKDYYEVLEIPRDADASTIKKAYRQLALEWHPDKNPHRREEAEQRFKEISEAYQVLSDEDKKKQYDMFGKVDPNQENEHAGGGGPFGGRGFMNPDDIFRMFFGGRNPMEGMGGMPFGHNPMDDAFGGMGHFHVRRTQTQKAPPKTDVLEFPLSTFYNGGKKKVTTRVTECCKNCDGKGGKNFRNCPTCDGRGIILQQRMIGPGMIQRIQSECRTCSGKCKVPELVCNACNGEKVTYVLKSYVIDIERGMKEGDRILFEGMGNEMDGMEKGDMIFMLKEKQDGLFERRGDDLYYKQEMLLGDSLIGYFVEIEDMKGDKIKYYEKGVIQPNSMRKIRTQGMPIRGMNRNGDLYVIYKIKYGITPEITNDQKKILRDIFPCLQYRDEEVNDEENPILRFSEIIINMEH